MQPSNPLDLPLRAHEPELLARRARPHMEHLRDRLEEPIDPGMLRSSYSARAGRFPLDRVEEIADAVREAASGLAGDLRAPAGWRNTPRDQWSRSWNFLLAYWDVESAARNRHQIEVPSGYGVRASAPTWFR